MQNRVRVHRGCPGEEIKGRNCPRGQMRNRAGTASPRHGERLPSGPAARVPVQTPGTSGPEVAMLTSNCLEHGEAGPAPTPAPSRSRNPGVGGAGPAHGDPRPRAQSQSLAWAPGQLPPGPAPAAAQSRWGCYACFPTFGVRERRTTDGGGCPQGGPAAKSPC